LACKQHCRITPHNYHTYKHVRKEQNKQKMVGPAGLEPATNSLTYHYSFHYQISLFVVWTMPLPLSRFCQSISFRQIIMPMQTKTLYLILGR
jgi:hypothetical protein